MSGDGRLPGFFFHLRAGAADGFYRQRGASRFLGDVAVLLDDEAARRLVFLQAVEQLRRHAPVGALRAVLIDDVEEHEFVLGPGARFRRHAALYTKRNASATALAPYLVRNGD